MTIYRGDDTDAFGGNFLKITLKNTSSVTVAITKAVFKCGSICKEFDNPEFPLTINLTQKETAILSPENTCYLAVWDENGKKRTCEGSLTFNADARRV